MKTKKYTFNKERFTNNLFILNSIVIMNIIIFFIMNNIENFITTL